MAEVFLTGRCGWKHVFPISEKLCQEMGWYRVGADETESSGGKLTSLVLGPFDMSTVHSLPVCRKHKILLEQSCPLH